MLSHLRKALSNNRGFTLIELLVVIAIIGILAVAVLSAINPIEQINKGKDTQQNSDAAQVLGASERYYTNQQLYPWNVAATGFDPTAAGTGWGSNPTVVPTTAVNFDGTAAGSNWNWVNNLLTATEVKDTFANRLMNHVAPLKVLRAAGSNSNTYVCYYPLSNSSRKQADTYCLNNKTALQALPGGGPCSTYTGVAPAVPGTNAICVP